MSETVKLDITVEINEHDPEYDTEITVEEWNALSDVERSAVYQHAWQAMAEGDNGGVRVVTEGAKEI